MIALSFFGSSLVDVSCGVNLVLLNPKWVRTRKSPTLAVDASRERDKVKTAQRSHCLHFDRYVLNHKHSGMAAFRNIGYYCTG
jgi:hypothetical protein